MSERPTALNRPPRVSAFDKLERTQEEELASEVERIQEAIKDFAESEVRAAIYYKPSSGVGSWSWCDDASLPLDMPTIMADMKERFGPGQYELRVTAKGRVRANSPFSISKERTSAMAAAPAQPAMGTADLFALMMQQQDAARRDQAAAADRQMTMITTLMTTLVPVLAGGRQQTGTSAAEIAALVTALRPEGGQGGGLKDTLEAMAAFKTLMGGDGGEAKDGDGGLDMNDLVGSGARLVGPAMKALGDYIANQRRPAGEPGGPSVGGTGETQAPPGQLTLGPPGSRFRLIELVKVDVAYGFSRGHDPEKIADLVYDVVEANHVTGAEIDELAAHFALSPTGLEDLAREGIDLRSNPQWAAEFFAALHAIHTGAADDLDGGDGRAPDLGGNGEAGA